MNSLPQATRTRGVLSALLSLRFNFSTGNSYPSIRGSCARAFHAFGLGGSLSSARLVGAECADSDGDIDVEVRPLVTLPADSLVMLVLFFSISVVVVCLRESKKVEGMLRMLSPKN
jgi:hypothetical protein